VRHGGSRSRVNFSFRAAQAFPCAFIQAYARRLARTPLAVTTEKHDPRILLPSAVHQFTEVFIPGDKDRFLTVRSREQVRIIRAWGYLGNIINLISRLTAYLIAASTPSRVSVG
jgi:hypothetical protein